MKNFRFVVLFMFLHVKSSLSQICRKCEIFEPCYSNLTCADNSFAKNFQCVCLDGFYMNEQRKCVPCLKNNYCISDNKFACHSNSITLYFNASSASDCQCIEGYEPRNSSCSPCAVGFYKPVVGNVQCRMCSSESVATIIGQSACQACKEFETANARKQKCDCIDGFYRRDDSCLVCPRGYFCQNETATKCPKNMITEKNAISAADCMCDQGYFYDNNSLTCQACSAGKYQNNYGQSQCLDCPRATYGLLFAAKSADECSNCPSGKTTFTVGNTDRESCVRNNSFIVAKTIEVKKLEISVLLPLAITQVNARVKRNLKKSVALSINVPESKVSIVRVKNKQQLRRLLSAWTEIDIEVADTEATTISAETLNLNLQQLNETSADLQNTSSITTQAEILTVCGFGFYANDSVCLDCSVAGNSAYTITNTSNSVNDCLFCPPNSGFANNSIRNSIQNCACFKGYSQFDLSGCRACDAGKFKHNISNNDCALCSAGSYSAEGSTSCTLCYTNSVSLPGSTSIADCYCMDGFAFQNNSCVACLPGTYSSNGMPCSACPANQYSNKSATSSCLQCAADQYTSSIGSSKCSNCAEHSVYDYAKLACSCQKGYYKENDVCMPCAFGHYKSSVGDEQCSSCPHSKSTPSTASTHIENCTLCLTNFVATVINESQICTECFNNSVAMLISSDEHICVCAPGFFLDEVGTCAGCEVGKYKPSYGNGICDNCPAGFSTHATTSSKLSDCYECESGKYGPYVFGGGAQVCVDCMAFSSSASGSTVQGDCICNAGYTLHDVSYASCVSCSHGKYKPISGNEECLECPAGFRALHSSNKTNLEDNCARCTDNTYVHALPNLSSTCMPCPPNSITTSNINLSSCECNAGYYADGFACIACSAGKYKQHIANTHCLSCTDTQFSVNGLYCLDCMAHSHTSMPSFSNSTCICDAGYEFQQNACVLCKVGTFRTYNSLTEIQNSGCVACPPNTYYKAISAVNEYNLCTPCPANSISLSGSSQIQNCTCLEGYTRTTSNLCAPCSAGFYCPDQFLQKECPMYSSSAQFSTSEANCTCNAGFYKQELVCMPCPVNYYCPGDDSMLPCYGNSSTLSLAKQESVDSCICNEGFFFEDDACEICPPNFFCYAENITQCPANSTSITGMQTCVCDNGHRNIGTGNTVNCIECTLEWVCKGNNAEYECASFAQNVDDACICTTGRYCSNAGTDCFKQDSSCEVCKQDFFCRNNSEIRCPDNSHSDFGSHSIKDCKCDPGYYRLNDACVACPQNTYCVDEILHTCTSFDQHLEIPYTHARSRTECRCQEGYFRVNNFDTCKKCPKNFYCPQDVNLPNVRACLPNEYTLAEGAGSREDCICDAGHKLSSSGDVSKCLPCDEGERCVNGEVQEFQCHVFKRAPNEDHSKCVCIAGFYEDSFLQCVPCEFGFYKSEPGDHACSACPAGTQSKNSTYCEKCPQHKTSLPVGRCFCEAPYVADDDSSCKLCPANHYRESATTCHACPEFSSSVPGAVRRENCECMPGYIYHNMSCIPCERGFYQKENACVACPYNSHSELASFSVENCTCNATQCQIQMPDKSCMGICADVLPNCSECEKGWHKDVFGNAVDNSTCQRCFFDTFSEHVASQKCTECHNSTTTLQDTASSYAQCVCKTGYEADPARSTSQQVVCKPCSVGFFKADPGNHACEPCSVGTYQDQPGQAACIPCRNRTTNANTTLNISSSDVAQCVCLPGYYRVRDVCIPCAGGSFKSKKGDHACTFCSSTSEDYGVSLLHTFSESGPGQTHSSVCNKCPQHSGANSLLVEDRQIVMDDADKCKCFAGYFYNTTTQQCEACAHYQFRRDISLFEHNMTNYSIDTECKFCDANHFFVSAYQGCLQCYLQDFNGGAIHSIAVNTLYNASWAISEDDCVCRLGMFRDEDTCYECAAGTYRSIFADNTCRQCEAGKYQSLSASSSCVSCPLNSTHSIVGSTDNQNCLCNAGYEWNGDSCDACTPGKYSLRDASQTQRHDCTSCVSGKYSSTIAAQACTECGVDEISLAPFDGVDTCACKSGYGGTPCTACLVGFFAGGRSLSNTHSPCTACPAFKTTLNISSISQGQCVCQPGYGTSNASSTSSPCEICTTGKYAAGYINSACSSCGNFTITDPPNGAASFDACYCNHVEGFYYEQ